MPNKPIAARPRKQPAISLALAHAVPLTTPYAGVFAIGSGSSVSTGSCQILLGCSDAKIGGGLTGTSNQPLPLDSSAAPQSGRLPLDFGATQMINSVDIAYIDYNAGQAIAPGDAADCNATHPCPSPALL